MDKSDKKPREAPDIGDVTVTAASDVISTAVTTKYVILLSVVTCVILALTIFFALHACALLFRVTVFKNVYFLYCVKQTIFNQNSYKHLKLVYGSDNLNIF